MNSYRHTAMQHDCADRSCNMSARGKQNYICNEYNAFSTRGKAVYSSSKTQNFSKECSDDMNDYPLAMAYVPWQSFENLNEPYNALECGTLFKDLYLCFGRGCN